MPEELNANTEGGTPSPNDVGATGAGGDSAIGQQATDPGQTTPQPAAEEFSAGWTFEDQPEAQSIPDGDDDLQGMTTDPNLDQTRVPGLVEAIKTARAEARQANKDLKQL